MNTVDKKFLIEMVAHHQVALRMATMVLQDGEDQEVKKLAQSIISAQQQEISQMKEIIRRGANEQIKAFVNP
jgi:uncharacterized protein (DUF305 family)